MAKKKQIKRDIFKKKIRYNYNRVFFWVSVGLIIALVIVIRGSKAPMLFDNGCLEYLLCSDPNEDKTLYNVGISYIAAYFFYLLQVHIGEVQRQKRYERLFSNNHREAAFRIERIIVSWQVFDQHNGYAKYRRFRWKYQTETNRIKEDTVTKDSYFGTLEELEELLHNIIKSETFLQCDTGYIDYLCSAYNYIAAFCYELKKWDDPSEEELFSISTWEREQIASTCLKSIKEQLCEIEKIKIENIGNPEIIKEENTYGQQLLALMDDEKTASENQVKKLNNKETGLFEKLAMAGICTFCLIEPFLLRDKKKD